MGNNPKRYSGAVPTQTSDPDAVELAPPAVPFVGRLYTPREIQGRQPGLLIIGGSGGGMPWERARAAAAAGIPSLAVAYFKAPGLPHSLRAIALEYFRAPLEWLSGLPTIDPDRLVVMGISRGSEAALLTGICFPGLVAAVAALVPGNVVLGSWPPGGPAWTLNGQPLPFVSRFGPHSEIPDALIAIESINGPIALVGAGRDRVWPSLAMARALAERREAAGRQHQADLLLEYPLAGHDVGAVVSASDDRAPRDDAWPQLLEFIRAVPARGLCST